MVAMRGANVIEWVEGPGCRRDGGLNAGGVDAAGVQAGTVLHVRLMLRKVSSAARCRARIHVATQPEHLQSFAESAHETLLLLHETT